MPENVRLARSIRPSDAIFGAVALMLSHSLWWHSTMLEVYTLNTALMAIILFFVVRYDQTRSLSNLYGAVFCFGLAISNHVLMGLFVFAFAGLFLAPSQRTVLWRPRVLLALAFFFLVGIQLYLFVFLKDYAVRFNRLDGPDLLAKLQLAREMLDETTGGHFKKYMFRDDIPVLSQWKWRLNYLFMLLMNYPSVAFVLGWIGTYAFWRREAFRLSFAFFALAITAQAIWSSNYMIWDMYAFGLPVWVLFGLLVALGADRVWRSGGLPRRAGLALIPTLVIGPFLYVSIPDWARSPGFWRDYFEQFQYVSNMWYPAEYFANPIKRSYDEPARIADRFFEEAEPGAHVFDDDGKGYYPLALYYQRVGGRRPDLKFHAIFGPTMNNANAVRHAREIKQLLSTGSTVYISSPYWPERPVLDRLYDLLAAGDGQLASRDSARMSVDQLENSFPKYRLERVPLSDDGEFYVYRFDSRGGRSARGRFDLRLEGERLLVQERPPSGNVGPQTLGEAWSRGAHLLWLDGRVGDTLELSFFVPRDVDAAEIRMRLTRSYDFARCSFAIDGRESALDFDGYAPTVSRAAERLVARTDLAKGRHTLTIRIEGSNPKAAPKFGFGLDYLRIREVSSRQSSTPSGPPGR